MKTPMKLKAVLFLLLAGSIFSCNQATSKAATTDTGKRAANDTSKHVKKPLASPRDSISGTIGASTITINYGSPAVKGRKIWGGLEKYNAVWRAGANEATTFTTSKDIIVEGKKLPAGEYGFFLIPTPAKWTVIFNSVPKQWGAFKYDSTKDVLRVQVMPVPTPLQERLKYTIDNKGFNMVWEKVTIPVMVK